MAVEEDVKGLAKVVVAEVVMVDVPVVDLDVLIVVYMIAKLNV